MLKYSVFLRLEDPCGAAPADIARALQQMIEATPLGFCSRFRIRELAVRLDHPRGERFQQVGSGVMLGSKCVLTARSKTMAKRAANALNRHITTREGV